MFNLLLRLWHRFRARISPRPDASRCDIGYMPKRTRKTQDINQFAANVVRKSTGSGASSPLSTK